MYNVIEDVIKKGEYKLADIIYKINKLWLENQITAEEQETLKNMAYNHININNEYPDLQKQISSLGIVIEGILRRVSILENNGEPPAIEIQEWQQWNGLPYGGGGVGIYGIGDKVMRENRIYESMINNNTYDPLIVDERIWKEKTE